MKTTRYLFAASVLFLATGCAADRVEWRGAADKAPVTAYERLLALYPEDTQGVGKENFFPTLEHQPMTYGLIASAESLHFARTHGDESGRRIRKAVRWLLDNQDLDGDGKPGWGLPQEWDAFADKTTNPVNHPYTITTAIVMNGLLDALAVADVWSAAERDEMRAVMAKVVLRWCRELWSDGFTGGYFWYSPNPADAIFAVNSPSMFLGSMSRLLREQGGVFNLEERRFVQRRADDMARAIVTTVELRQGFPFWDYRQTRGPADPKRPNDLIHHVYTLWGIETYRDCGGTVKLPWTRTQAIESVDRFWRDGRIAEFPQDVVYTDKQAGFSKQPAILWSAGMMLAAYAKWGDEPHAKQAFEAIDHAYGPMPQLHIRVTDASKDEAFYPRQAAHVLWALALYAFEPAPGPR